MNYFRDDHDSPVPEEPIVNENFIEVASEDPSDENDYKLIAEYINNIEKLKAENVENVNNKKMTLHHNKEMRNHSRQAIEKPGQFFILHFYCIC